MHNINFHSIEFLLGTVIAYLIGTFNLLLFLQGGKWLPPCSLSWVATERNSGLKTSIAGSRVEMKKNLNGTSVDLSAVRVEKTVTPGLKRFVKAIKDNLRNQARDENLSPATIQSAEMPQKKFTEWGSRGPDVSGGKESGSHLFNDYILHHRVGLATEIVKSMADGQRLSHKREKVLKNSIDYIEQRL